MNLFFKHRIFDYVRLLELLLLGRIKKQKNESVVYLYSRARELHVGRTQESDRMYDWTQKLGYVDV